jgi:hypothetical protein
MGNDMPDLSKSNLSLRHEPSSFVTLSGEVGVPAADNPYFAPKPQSFVAHRD